MLNKLELKILSVLIFITFILILFQLPAYFFDIFGFITFTFLFILGVMIKLRKKIPASLGFILITISILGLIVDGVIVIQSYLLK